MSEVETIEQGSACDARIIAAGWKRKGLRYFRGRDVLIAIDSDGVVVDLRNAEGDAIGFEVVRDEGRALVPVAAGPIGDLAQFLAVSA